MRKFWSSSWERTEKKIEKDEKGVRTKRSLCNGGRLSGAWVRKPVRKPWQQDTQGTFQSRSGLNFQFYEVGYAGSYPQKISVTGYNLFVQDDFGMGEGSRKHGQWPSLSHCHSRGKEIDTNMQGKEEFKAGKWRVWVNPFWNSGCKGEGAPANTQVASILTPHRSPSNSVNCCCLVTKRWLTLLWLHGL